MQVSLLFHPSFRNKQSCKRPISRHWAAKNKAGNVEACLLFTAVLKILPTLLPGLTLPKQNNSYVLLSCLRCCDGGAGRFSTKLSDGNARSLLGLPNFIYTPALIANVTYWKHVVRPGNRPVAGGKPSSCELRSFWRITPWFDGIEAKSLELLYLQVYLASERMGKIFKHGVGLLLNFLLLLLAESDRIRKKFCSYFNVLLFEMLRQCRLQVSYQTDWWKCPQLLEVARVHQYQEWREPLLTQSTLLTGQWLTGEQSGIK